MHHGGPSRRPKLVDSPDHPGIWKKDVAQLKPLVWRRAFRGLGLAVQPEHPIDGALLSHQCSHGATVQILEQINSERAARFVVKMW